ncbi:hypothetical protein GALMADRAFT_147026 [Galerina marginata CBS 339.88]|uniref:F-box domain-containing protein n=1 Tax=Galerina marginata (strain CBS 339.88) TaxID=685588 RepID=A0A067SL62_GALM3|nr:hypothetical protein GALMADRAFT_147026 [Galerina marginata CBS 339.88]
MKRVVKSTSEQVKNKATATRKKAVGLTKYLVVRSIPGVSKLELPVPPIPHLLLSNVPPSDSQAILISNALLQGEIEQQRLMTDLETNGKNNSVGWKMACKHKIQQAVEFIRQHRSILSPMRRLPEEILEELFRWTVPPGSERQWSNIPWKLGHICRAWRASALAASFLWNVLPPITLDESVKSRYRTDIVNELLIRSGKRPLEELYIHSPSDILRHPIIDIICRHSERWQSFSFNLTSTTLAAFSAIKGRLLCLKSLKLRILGGDEDDGTPAPPLDMFENAPFLQELSVSGTYPKRLILPFSRLLYYKQRSLLGSSAPGEVFASPFLQKLILLNIFGNIGPLPVSNLPCLVELQISSAHEPFNVSFLDNLTLSAIEVIKIDTVRGNVLRSLIAVMGRSSNMHSLKHLGVRDRSLLSGDLTALLKLAPGLLNLDITIPSASDIYKLATGDEDGPLVPSLKTCIFYIIGGSVPSETSQALNGLASSRCEMSLEDAQQSSYNDSVPDIDELRPIGSLRIYLGTPFLLHNSLRRMDEGWDAILQQAALENWSESTKSVKLQALRRRLHQSLPGYRHGPKLNTRWFNNVNGILTSIESMDLSDPRDIYLSEIHFSVKRLGQLVIWNDDEFNISNRASNLLKKWNLLFKQTLANRHWAFQGTHSIVYIPDNHPIRKTLDSLNIVYGLSGGSRRLATTTD